MIGHEGAAPRRHAAWRKWIPLLLLALGLAAVFAFDLERFLSFDALQRHRASLMAQVDAHPLQTAALYFIIYAAAIAFSVPGGAVLSIAGGCLFGSVLGSVLVICAATLGACIVFLAARTALRDLLRRRAGPFLQRMEEGFRKNGFHYLLVLRLVPLFPFWLVNLVPAFFGMSLRRYALATVIGIAPASIVFASLGSGLGSLLDAGQTPDLGILFTPRLLLPILGLALLALTPVVYRRLAPSAAPPSGPGNA